MAVERCLCVSTPADGDPLSRRGHVYFMTKNRYIYTVQIPCLIQLKVEYKFMTSMVDATPTTVSQHASSAIRSLSTV